MIACRGSAAALLVIGGAVLAAAALAQTGEVGPPRQLIPQPQAIEVGPPPKAVPPAPPQLPAAPPRPPAATPTPAPTPASLAPEADHGCIQVERLQSLDPSSVGVLDEDQGGLGVDMWAGTSRALVERLLSRLPAGTRSRAMRRLMRVLLLSAAKVPEGEPTVPSLLGLRVERLAAAGDMEAVRQLINLAPNNLDDARLARAEVAGRLLAGDNAGACDRAQAMVRVDEDSYWLKAMAFCKALNGEHAAAQVGMSLLREQGTDDRVFFTLIEALAGDERAVVDSLIAPTALHLAMLRAARRSIPADAVEGANPAILRVIATSPNANLQVRLTAAERAEAAGTLSARALAQIYASIAFSPEEMSNALSLAESDHGPGSRALLYQVAAIETVPTARAEALQKTWALASESGGFGTAARVGADSLLALEPSAELLWLVPDAGRALLAAGKFEAASAWFQVALRRSSQADPEAGFAALSLWPLMVIANPSLASRWTPEVLARWVASQRELPEALRQQRLSVMFSLLDGLDLMPDAGQWEALLEGPLNETTYMPSPALWRGLENAAAAGRVGETVLLALLTLGDLGPGGADPLALRAVIAALSAVGLDEHARAIALEAALVRGF
ncbi:MAG: hypothetical protein O7A68_06935 [Alphaproteobacteria bacterium]|nr:hypothetical protein [Alphaproteobacteria bacterium]